MTLKLQNVGENQNMRFFPPTDLKISIWETCQHKQTSVNLIRYLDAQYSVV